MFPLKKLKEFTATAAYDPTTPPVPTELQTITVYPPPLFIFSPRTKVYAADDIRRFKGYLSKFEPSETEADGPTCTLTITPIKGDPNG